MLVLSRKVGEQILIGPDVCVTVVSIKGNRITLGIDAPEAVRIDRSELAGKIVSEQAADPCEAASSEQLTPRISWRRRSRAKWIGYRVHEGCD